MDFASPYHEGKKGNLIKIICCNTPLFPLSFDKIRLEVISRELSYMNIFFNYQPISELMCVIQ